ncbi:MAG: SurA N-terminal domain-containing protein [Porphyromonadaceae bacterium]|nr:SurA N-terminal domain-containing protein [Porphyromonadaceae bacterium]
MAVLEKIRNNAGLLVGGIGVALFAFIIGDGLRSGGTWFQQRQQVALSVNGQEVGIQDYDARFQTLTSQMGQGGSLTDEQRMMLNNQLRNEYITDFALAQITEELGLRVTPEEVYALLVGQGVTPSPMASQFFSRFGIDATDTQAVNDFISQMSEKSFSAMSSEQQSALAPIRAQWQTLQKSIINNRLQEKYLTLLSRSYKVTKLDEEVLSGMGTRSVALVRTTPMVSVDSTSRPTDEEIKKFYEERKSGFRMPYPTAEVSYISTQVTPSSEDYAAAAEAMQQAYTALSEASTMDQVEDALRSHNEKFVAKAYLTTSDLDQLGVGAEEIEFLRNASLGSVNSPRLVSDRYSLVKLIDKKQGVGTMGVRLIALDSAMSTKTDSLMALLASGADFADLARKHSIDPSTAQNGGLLMFPGQYGQMDSTFSEYALTSIGLDTLYRAPFGSVVTLDRGFGKFLIKAVNSGAVVDKYRFASATIPAVFSSKTYNARYDALNKILAAGGSFADMAAKAEVEGFLVRRSVSVSTDEPQLGGIPSSRPVITWAMNAKEGELVDKVYRCGSDYLVVASLDKSYPAGYTPLAAVREQIASYLETEKRAKALATQLAAKGLTTLEAYAADMNASIDTLVGVSYVVRGREGAAFNGQAMTTPIGQLSKPFASNSEVIVLQPYATEPADATAISAQSMQQASGVGRQLGQRAFAELVQSLKVEDNRARFY